MMQTRGTGALADKFDLRDYLFTSEHLVGASIVPKSADLSGFVDYVRDQGHTNACTGMAITSALYIRALIEGVEDAAHADPYAAYALGRAFMLGDANQALTDNGCQPRAVIEALKAVGMPPQVTRDFDPASINSRPNWRQLRAGFKYRPKNYHWVEGRVDERFDKVCRALANGFPVCLSIQADEQVFSTSDGLIDKPNGKSKGAHYVTAVGFQDGVVKILNSWSDKWADNGYGYLTQDRLKDVSTRSLMCIGIERI